MNFTPGGVKKINFTPSGVKKIYFTTGGVKLGLELKAISSN
jgi:hypothetical protein